MDPASVERKHLMIPGSPKQQPQQQQQQQQPDITTLKGSLKLLPLPGRVCSVGHQSADQEFMAVLSSDVEWGIAILIHTIDFPALHAERKREGRRTGTKGNHWVIRSGN